MTPLPPCRHRLEVTRGYLACSREDAHGGPHECPIGNDTAFELVEPLGGRPYRSAATVVWHETKESPGG